MGAYKILIVEDEKIAALSLKETLENLGYSVTGQASNTREAIDSIELSMPDLVLMDINLEQKLEGIAAGKNIMESYVLPVIFLTAFSDTDTILKAKEVFPYGYMVKPYQEMELFAIIETAIYKHIADRSQKELIRTKDKFFSVVAHDLRSPFAALEVTTRMLKKKAVEMSKEELQEFVSEIHQTVETLYSFTDNLLEWARIQSGRISIYPQNIVLEGVVKQVFELLQGKAAEKKIKLISRCMMETTLVADSNMLRSVILNLIHNSLKFSEVGGEVELSACEKGNFAEIIVRDKGVGIEEERVSRIFDFNNSSSLPGTHEEKGTGLGLLLCKEFIEANGGEISLKSRLGEGTKVRFTLPLTVL